MTEPAHNPAIDDTPPARSPGYWQRLAEPVARRGGRVLFRIGEFVEIAARGCAPGNWRRTMRDEFGEVLYHVGVRAVPAVIVIALLVAVGLVAQVVYWLSFAGEEARIGDFLAMSLVRQIGPVMTVLIIIGRSGAVMVDEIGQMQINGQLRALASQGIDPIDYIILPRTFATALSAVLLTQLFVHTALWFGFATAAFADLTKITSGELYAGVFGNLGLNDHLLLIVKPALSGYVVAYLSIRLGMNVTDPTHGIRRALPKAFVYSLLATFAIGALITVLL